MWVREKWVGLLLPLSAGQSPKEYHTVGAVSGPRKLMAQLWAFVRGRTERLHGYPVEAGPAVDILERASPEAAAWWRQNASELIRPRRYLVFHAEVCQIVAE